MDTQDAQQLFVEEVALLEKLRAGPMPRPMVIRFVDWSESLIEYGLAEEDAKGMLRITGAGHAMAQNHASA